MAANLVNKGLETTQVFVLPNLYGGYNYRTRQFRLGRSRTVGSANIGKKLRDI